MCAQKVIVGMMKKAASKEIYCKLNRGKFTCFLYIQRKSTPFFLYGKIRRIILFLRFPRLSQFYIPTYLTKSGLLLPEFSEPCVWECYFLFMFILNLFTVFFLFSLSKATPTSPFISLKFFLCNFSFCVHNLNSAHLTGLIHYHAILCEFCVWDSHIYIFLQC